MTSSPYLIINKLVLKGPTNTYTARFEEGLNIIWGDMDSGKSSILNLIDFCLGGNNETLLYGEMASKVRIAYLEANLNGRICTFERSIFEQKSAVKIYSSAYREISKNFPMLVSAQSTSSMPDGWLSDFILENLGIARVRIRESRVREDADSDRLSFRDLMKLLYLKQTKIGADSLLNYGNLAVFNKNIEIQKFIFNIHDDRLASLNQELATELRGLSELKMSEASISKFLKDVDIEVLDIGEFETELKAKQNNVDELEEGIKELKNNYKFSSELALKLRQEITNLSSLLTKTVIEKNSVIEKQKNYSLLKNTYQTELDCLVISKLTHSLMEAGSLEKHPLSCPLCAQVVSITSPILDEETLAEEVKSIKNKLSGVQSALETLWKKQFDLDEKEQGLSESIKAYSKDFDTDQIENISPLVANIQAIEKQRSELEVQTSKLLSNVSISNKYFEISRKIDSKEGVVAGLRRGLKQVQEGLLGLEEVIEKLTSLLIKYLSESGLQNSHGIFIDKSFIPHFRNISYYKTSSGGVRTITSIAGFVTRLRYLLDNVGNLPTFLMIDTPGQNIGRYRRTDDNDSQTSDPVLYENIYKQIWEVVDAAKAKNKRCQIIVVDNDLPHFLERNLDFYLVKRFAKKGGEFEKGLINDFIQPDSASN